MLGCATEFDELVSKYYQSWFRFFPEQALEVGVKGYENNLRPLSNDDYGALAALTEKVLCCMGEFSYNELNSPQQINCGVLYGSAFLQHYELCKEDWRQKDPIKFIPVEAIYQLTIREVDDFHQALKSRLSQVPDHLSQARHYLSIAPERVPPIWAEMAITESQAGVEYFHSLADDAKIKACINTDHELSTIIENAASSLNQYAQFIEAHINPKAQGQFACGRTHFDHLLNYKHFLCINADQLAELGQKLLDTTRSELKAVTKKITGNEDIQALTDKIKQNHPPADQLLTQYNTTMLSAYEFVKTHDLITIPEQTLNIQETPIFFRHQIPFAAYLQPSLNDPNQLGRYCVTPAQDNIMLAEHNFPSIGHTCVHEAWPGHHAQFATANHNPSASSLTRSLNTSATLYEGWALYCEQMMVEQGFLKQPENQFILLRDRLWRCLRIIIDVGIHTQNMTVSQAVDLLCKELGFPEQQAKADVMWYTCAPTTPMSYAVGSHLINAARSLYLQDHSLKQFHDQLLSYGSIALPLVLGDMLGNEPWKNIEKQIFNL